MPQHTQPAEALASALVFGGTLLKSLWEMKPLQPESSVRSGYLARLNGEICGLSKNSLFKASTALLRVFGQVRGGLVACFDSIPLQTLQQPSTSHSNQNSTESFIYRCVFIFLGGLWTPSRPTVPKSSHFSGEGNLR